MLACSVMSDSLQPKEQAVARQAPLNMGFCKQEYQSGLPLPPLGDLPDPGIKPASPAAPSSAGRFFATEPHGSPIFLSAGCLFFPLPTPHLN